jgi:hypothetical protein
MRVAIRRANARVATVAAAAAEIATAATAATAVAPMPAAPSTGGGSFGLSPGLAALTQATHVSSDSDSGDEDLELGLCRFAQPPPAAPFSTSAPATSAGGDASSPCDGSVALLPPAPPAEPFSFSLATTSLPPDSSATGGVDALAAFSFSAPAAETAMGVEKDAEGALGAAETGRRHLWLRELSHGECVIFASGSAARCARALADYPFESEDGTEELLPRFAAVVGGRLPSSGRSSFTVLMSRSHSSRMRYVDSDEWVESTCNSIVGVCDVRAGTSWAWDVYGELDVCSHLTDGSWTLAGCEGPTPTRRRAAFRHAVSAPYYDLDVSFEIEPLSLHVQIVVDADAGTVSTFFNKHPRGFVLSGFPPGVSLRPWARPAPEWPATYHGGRMVVAGIDGAESVVFE